MVIFNSYVKLPEGIHLLTSFDCGCLVPLRNYNCSNIAILRNHESEHVKTLVNYLAGGS